jgi:DNA-binding transcriptional LysR family regulator
MELQQMRYVVAVAETSNFTRAAERCHVVQSALSHQIKRLEHELGTALFARTSRQVRLTLAGEAFLPAARQALEAAERAAADAAATVGEVRGRLSVGVIPTVAAVDVPAALRDLRRRHPQVRVSLRTAGSEVLTSDVAAGRLDVAFLGLPSSARPTGVSRHELARDRLVAVLAPDHPLAGAEGLDLADLAAEPFVDFPYGSAGRAQTDQAFARAGLSRDVAFEVTDAPLMAQVIRHGLAIGFLPSAYLRRAPELGGLATATVTDAPSRVEYVIWGRPGASPATRAFLTAVGLPSAPEDVEHRRQPDR